MSFSVTKVTVYFISFLIVILNSSCTFNNTDYYQGGRRLCDGDDNLSPSSKPLVMSAAYSSESIKIDGKLDDPVWKTAEVYKMFIPDDCKGPLKSGGTVQLAWDDEYFYLAATFEDDDIIAEGTQDQLKHFELGDLCEFFIKPSEQTWYWELYVTPAGYKTSYWFPGRGRFGLPSNFNYQCGLKVAADYSSGTLNNWRDKDKYWIAEMAMPVKDLESFGDKFQPGTHWRILVARYDYSRYHSTRGPEYSSSPKLSETNFHLYEEYAVLQLVKKENIQP